MNSWKRATVRFSLIVGTVLVLGLVGVSSALAQGSSTQPPSAFEIDADGAFTTPDEWSDVVPAVRNDGGMLVYTSVDPDLGALYLMYDHVASEVPVDEAGPVHFHNAGSFFEVFFTLGGGIFVLKDGAAFDLSDPNGGEDSIQGARGFGPSPDSAIPHNMFELEVLFDGSDPTLSGHSHGQYSPDPSHWGASLPTDPRPPLLCTELAEETICDPDGPVFVPDRQQPFPCPVDPNQTIPIELVALELRSIGLSVSIGVEASNACVNVVRGSGGDTTIHPLPIPGETIPPFEVLKPTSIEVSKTASFEGRFVSGTISITNVGENPALISAIEDTLEVHFPRKSDPPPLPDGSTPNWFEVADVPVAAPGLIEVGETVDIDYSFDLCFAEDFDGANSMRNVVAVTLANKPEGAKKDTVVTRSESFKPQTPECPLALPCVEPVPSPLGWTPRAPVPIGVEGATGVIIGPKIYVTHGFLPGDGTATQIYDIPTNTWDPPGANASVARSELAGVCAIEDGVPRVFAIGGRPPQTTVEVYDPGTDTWTPAPPMLTARRGLCATYVPTVGPQGTIFAIGGGTGGTVPHSGVATGANEAYDVAAAVWAPRAAMPTPVMGVYACLWHPVTNLVYVFGGFDSAAGAVSNLVQRYDPVANAWLPNGAPMPTARSNAIAGICKNDIYVIGGLNPGVFNNRIENERYDPFANAWAPALPLPSPRSEMASTAISTGEAIHAIGSGAFGLAANLHDRFECD